MPISNAINSLNQLSLDNNGQLYHENSVLMSTCARCKEPFIEEDINIVKSKNGNYHSRCFVCVQCFQPFENNTFYEFDGRKYCQRDFFKLYAPHCNKCTRPIIGRVIKALHASWHPECFHCSYCECLLENGNFVKLHGKPVCHDCNMQSKIASNNPNCHKCHAPIEDNQKLKYQSEFYHAYHFHCTRCGSELSADAREKDGDLFCIRCFDKIGMQICAACRRPIEERVIHALGKTWHVEHFMCARCEKPFLGTRHYEKRGLAYCELHYQELFGYTCFVCSQTISNDMVTALSKNWCLEHFICSMCDELMDPNKKFHELDLKPVCNGCYDALPNEFRKRIAKLHKNQ